jgi:phosphopantothenoylcysteine decarboxylase/phosphopantothenate--cysteine ligase
MSKSKNVLFIFTGSIACYKACNVLSKLKQSGYNIKTVMSPSSLEFVGRTTIEGLTGDAPLVDTFAKGHAMDHINLARWADLIIVAPATANYINKIANGIGDDLLTTLFLAHDFQKPFLLAPAMNTKMYLHPATQASIKQLKSYGVSILETASGVLACGEVGWGRLLEPDLIFKEIESALAIASVADLQTVPASQPKSASTAGTMFAPQAARKLNVLITSGGTSEEIDDVRVLTNKSTGRTAAAIADSLIEAGVDVTYLHSSTAALPQGQCEKISFTDYKNLADGLSQALKTSSFDSVVHAAAVSDYSVVKQAGKLDSQAEEVQLLLKKNPKLINEIKKWSPKSQLIGFKLTSGAAEDVIQKKVNSLFESAACDYVIQNDWQQKENGQHNFRVYARKAHDKYEAASGVQNLNQSLFQIIANQKTSQESL